VEGPATRPVGSGTVTSECWAWERDYVCSREVGRFDNCEPEPHCTFRGAQCLAQSDAGDCLTEERVYDCVTREDIVLDEGAPATCEDLEDPDGGATDGGSASRTLPDALAALQSAGAGAEDHRTSPEMFGGDPLKCSKLLLGTKNCCKRTGLLIGLGCGESSNRLRDARDNDRCIPLGAYCSKKALFGACLKKKETDCCYKSSLARIVIETAIRQTGLDLGSAKRPRCDGLSVTQFQLLDLSRADFSSVADDILSDMSVESAGDAAERLRRSIEAMQGQGTSGLPDDPAPWTPPSPPLPGG
ncbi:MAG: conjugal transfer protein TraN, partial [Litorimonas sp.]